MKRLLVLLLAFFIFASPSFAQFAGSGTGTGFATGGGVPSSYIGQGTITTLGTITTGVWQGTAISHTYLDANIAYINASNTFSLVQTLTAGATPATAGGAALGTAALPFSGIYIGNAATNNIQITGTATGARTLTLPDANSNPVVPSTAGANQFATAISSGGVITWTQPSFGNLSGSATLAQFPVQAQNTVLGSVTAGNNVPVALTATQLTTIPNAATDTLQGMAPALMNGQIYVGKTSSAIQAVSPGGDITSISNAGSFTIAAGAVTLAKQANLAANSIQGNNTGSPATPLALTATQTTAMLNLATASLQGMLPALADGQIVVGKSASNVQAVSPGGDVASISNAGSFTLATVNASPGTYTNATVTVNGKGLVTSASSGAAAGNVSFGGNGSDGAVSIAVTTSTDTRVYNATTFAVTGANVFETCPSCVINATSTISTGTSGNNNQIRANTTALGGQTFGAASLGGRGATGASSAGDVGYGALPGQPGNSGALIAPGGGAGAAGSGGAGGGATVASGFGEPGWAGSDQHFTGWLNGSGGGGGGAGASGTGGNGGNGGNHIILVTAGGFTGTGNILALGSGGATGGTLGNGGGGGGGGTIELFSASGNLPAMTVNASGGSGGSSSGVAANAGGGGGGYICGTVSGTTASPTFQVSAGGAGTGGSGSAGTSGQAGLTNIIASTTPTLPYIVYNELDSNIVGKNLCWIEIAKGACFYGKDPNAEKNHIFIWDGTKRQEMVPISFLASNYAAPGKFNDLCMALKFGGGKETAGLCDASHVFDVNRVFEQFESCPIKGTYPIEADTCDDTDLILPKV